MDQQHLDALSRGLAQAPTRRQAVQLLAAGAAAGLLSRLPASRASAQVEAQTNTTLGIKVKPRIFNARTDAQATENCGPTFEGTGVRDTDAAVARSAKKGGVDSGPGFVIGKKLPTSECAAGVFDLPGSDGIVLDRLGFDVSGYCGAGAPRFNVSFVDGTFEFYGCSAMTTIATFTDADGREWTTRRAALGANAGKEVRSMGIVHDEEGTARLDNIAIANATLKGTKPKRRKREK